MMKLFYGMNYEYYYIVVSIGMMLVLSPLGIPAQTIVLTNDDNTDTPVTLTCGDRAVFVCTLSASPLFYLEWLIDGVSASSCSGTCSVIIAPSHYTFTKDGTGTEYNVTIDPLKYNDNISMLCEDNNGVQSNTITTNIMVVPDDSTTTIEGLYNGNNIDFTMTTCVSPVDNVKVKWEKESNNQKSLIKEDNAIDTTTGVTLCLSSTDCPTNGISSEIQVLSDNSTGTEYYICIEINRDNVIIFQKCTTTPYKLKDTDSSTSSTTGATPTQTSNATNSVSSSPTSSSITSAKITTTVNPTFVLQEPHIYLIVGWGLLTSTIVSFSIHMVFICVKRNKLKDKEPDNSKSVAQTEENTNLKNESSVL